MQKPSLTAILSAIVPAPQISLDALRALSIDDLIAQLKQAAVRQSSAHISIGKMLVVLDGQRDEEKDKTLKGFVRKTVGEEIEPASYKVAKAFALVGEGHGTISEEQFDKSALNWLLTTSAILGFLEKHDEETGVRVREAVAMLLRAPNEKTGKALKAIKDSLKPEDEGGGAGDGDEKGDGKIVELPPVDLLSKEHVKALRDAIAGSQDEEKLALMIKGFRALHSLAVIQLRDAKITNAQKSAAPVAQAA